METPMNKNLLTLAFLLAIGFGGCFPWWNPDEPIGDDDPNPKTNSYFPLHAGNEWRYADVITAQPNQYRWQMKVLYDTIIEGRSLHFIEESRANDGKRVDLRNYYLEHRGTVVKKLNNLDNTDPMHQSIEWTIDFSAKEGTSDDRFGFVQERIDQIETVMGPFKDGVRIFFPAAAYDALPIIVFARGVGPVQWRPYGIPTDLYYTKVGDQRFGDPNF